MYITVMLTILQGFTTPSTQDWRYICSQLTTKPIISSLNIIGWWIAQSAKLKRHFEFIISFYLIKNQLPLQLHKEEQNSQTPLCLPWVASDFSTISQNLLNIKSYITLSFDSFFTKNDSRSMWSLLSEKGHARHFSACQCSHDCNKSEWINEVHFKKKKTILNHNIYTCNFSSSRWS